LSVILQQQLKEISRRVAANGLSRWLQHGGSSPGRRQWAQPGSAAELVDYRQRWRSESPLL